MTLSIIIVNYNVKYFLEQTIVSALKACQGIESEIWVVDNNSKDGSVELVEKKFPQVKLIANKDNPGFSKANNQAIKLATGKYKLLLNPDTLVQEDTFKKCIDFMDVNPNAGAIGVRMIDGKGIFLPESKRSLPTPSVAFYKLFGLSAIFPKHPIYSKYHLGDKPEMETTKADILSGAYMFMRSEALDKIGLLDESFFMYGEDIDLSYRFVLAGYDNYYCADTTIIHYKGESTKKGSLNYVKTFYNAMIIFAQKHYSGSSAKAYQMVLKGAIFLKAFLAIITSFFGKWNHLILDSALIFGSIEFIKVFWAVNIKHQTSYYPFVFTWVIVPFYVLVWMTSAYLNGAYDKPKTMKSALRGIVIGTFIIANLYAFAPENWRYSRAVILFGAIASVFWMAITRMILNYYYNRKWSIDTPERYAVAIIGSEEEEKRALSLIENSNVQIIYKGRIDIGSNSGGLGNYKQLNQLVEWFNIEEIIFCSKDLTNKEIVEIIDENESGLHFKILPENSESIIGSNSKDQAGELYAKDLNYSINQAHQRRNKRMFDICICGLFILLFPWLVMRKNRSAIYGNLFTVLLNYKTWIGYFVDEQENLPRLHPAVFTPKNVFLVEMSNKTKRLINEKYAKQWSLEEEWKIIKTYL